jgi:catechol 2,3-dioxygenase-like lactoylglutathione lyase family enzyme
MQPSVLGPPVQVAYVVPDVDVAARQWVADFGAGPFFIRRHIESHDVVYRNEPGVFDHSSAYGQWGTIMVELMQDHGTGPSVVREHFGPAESGLHHLAFIVPDLDDATRQLGTMGFELVMTARSTSTRYYFFDAIGTLGHMIELYERSTRLEAFYAMVRDAADGWTGADPVRELSVGAAWRQY